MNRIWEEGWWDNCLEGVGFAPDSADLLRRARARIAPEPRWREAVGRLHDRIFREDSSPSDLTGLRAPILEWDAEVGRIIDVMALLLEYPEVLRKNRARGIPDAVTHETLRDMDRWMQNFKKQHGHAGFDQVFWLRNHFCGNLFGLGRLQFEPGTASLPYHVYHHRESGRVIALAEEGIPCRQDGVPLLEGEGCWQTRYRETSGEIIGCPVNQETGVLIRETLHLHKDEWERKLRSGDAVLHVHIPEGGRLDDKECAGSLGQAAAFFARHFPETRYHAMMCQTWLLDPQLVTLDVVPRDSNIAKFAARFHRLACPGATDAQFFERIFSMPVVRGTALPCNNTLRRAIAPLLMREQILRVTGGVLFTHTRATSEL